MTVDPTVDQIVETTVAAAEQVRSFGVTPKVALLSHSNFGSSRAPSAKKMGKAAKILRERCPDLIIDGEMHAEVAFNEDLREQIVGESRLDGAANLLVFPNLDAANITLEMLKTLDNGLLVGPILLGAKLPAHVVTPAVSSRGILNMTAIAVKDAQMTEKNQE